MTADVCQYCGEQRNDLLQCAACGTVQYCNRTCQKSDWKKHKKNCSKPYKAVNLTGKGVGLLSTKTIKQGELIIREKAVVIIPFNQKKQVSSSMLMQQFEQLNEKTQNAVLSLHSEKSNSNNLQEKLNDILDCNGIEVVPVNSVALYLTIPRINHSCRPNVVWSWVAGSYNVKEIRAVREIEAGEELCANYIDSFEGTLSSCIERQKRLKKWHFTCTCEICSLEPIKREENDRIRESLSIYHQLIPKCMASWNLARAVEAAEMKLKTMEGVSDEMATLLPSTLLELYEMYSLAKVLNHKVSSDMESLAKRASRLSSQFGDRFMSDYTEKISQIEQECKQAMRMKH